MYVCGVCEGGQVTCRQVTRASWLVRYIYICGICEGGHDTVVVVAPHLLL